MLQNVSPVAHGRRRADARAGGAKAEEAVSGVPDPPWGGQGLVSCCIGGPGRFTACLINHEVAVILNDQSRHRIARGVTGPKSARRIVDREIAVGLKDCILTARAGSSRAPQCLLGL